MGQASIRRPRHTGHSIRAYLGTCLVCRAGCFQGDEVVRGRGQWLGLLHQHCADTIKNSDEEK